MNDITGGCKLHSVSKMRETMIADIKRKFTNQKKILFNKFGKMKKWITYVGYEINEIK